MATVFHINDSRAFSDRSFAARIAQERMMEFTEAHKSTLLREMESYFGKTVTIGGVDMSYANGDMPCIYVEFYVDGKRHLADVGTKGRDEVDWIY